MKRFLYPLAAVVLLVAAGSATDLKQTERISLDLEKTSLRTVLSTIARQYNLSLVISDDVKGDISIRLEEVTLEAALNSVLSASGCYYHMLDNVIVIRTANDASIGELDMRIYTLNYADPVAVQAALTPFLGNSGKAIVVARADAAGGGAESDRFSPNRIAVIDYVMVLTEVDKLIAELDQPERTILIECKIIETKVDTKSKLGLLWPSQFSTSFGNAEGTAPVTDETSTTPVNNAVDYDPENGNWFWGTLSVSQVTSVLDLLDQNGNSKLISDPRITALENHQSLIKVQTIVPIQTINRFSEGAVVQDIVTFQDEEIGISLKVTPRITADGKVTLDVHPEVEDIIGYTGPADNQKPITTSRSIQTRVSVKSGETVALGGLLKDDIIKRKQRFPLLGSIPILGNLLFTNHSEEKSTTDLIILITPTIVQ